MTWKMIALVAVLAVGCQSSSRVQQDAGRDQKVAAGELTGEVSPTAGEVSRAGIVEQVCMIATVKAQSPLGGPIPATVTLRNLRDRPIVYPFHTEEQVFSLTVVDRKGYIVPRADDGRHMQYMGGAGRIFLHRVYPGKELAKSYDLSKLFLFKQPGTYYLQADCVLMETAADGNELTAKVKNVPFEVTGVGR